MEREAEVDYSRKRGTTQQIRSLGERQIAGEGGGSKGGIEGEVRKRKKTEKQGMARTRGPGVRKWKNTAGSNKRIAERAKKGR